MNMLLINNTELISDNKAEISGERLKYVRQWHEPKDGIRISAGILGGQLCTAVIQDHGSKLILELSDFRDSKAVLPIKLVVGISRPPTMQKVITLASTFGVKELILLNTENTVKSYLSSKVLVPENQLEFVFKGLEQSGESIPPKITILSKFLDLGLHISENSFLADTIQSNKLSGDSVDSATIIFGPEKGFTDRERNFFKLKNISSFSLGERILRVEQAVAAGLGQFLLKL